jgi:hypothetical protein
VRFVDKFGNNHFGEPDDDGKNQVISGGSGTAAIDVTVIPTGPEFAGAGNPDYYIADRIMERTLVNGDPNGPFYFDGYIGDNSTTTYSFTQSDNDLLELELSPNTGRRLPMPKLWPLYFQNNRIIGADPTDLGKIVWSEIDEFGIIPGAFPAEHFLYLDVADWNDAPQAIAKLGEYLIVYCGRSVHLVYIDEGGAGYKRRIGGHRLGFPNPRCVAELPRGHIIWSYKGPYFFDGNNLIFIGEKIEASISAIPKGTLGEMYTVHRSQEQRRQIKFVFPESGSENNAAAKYHYRRASLSPEGFPTVHAWAFDNGFKAKSGAVILNTSNEEVEYEGDYSGNLYQADTSDTNDHDTNGLIDARARTRWEDCDKPHLVKNFEEIWVFIRGEAPENISLAWDTEFEAGVSGSSTLEVAEDTQALFDVAKFDQAVFSLENAQILHAHLGQDGVTAEGKFIRLSFSNPGANAPFTIMGYVLTYSIDRTRNDSVE